MRTALISVQMSSWHDGGLFMGAHWIWWLIAVVTLCAMAWALIRVSTDRSRTSRRVESHEIAEEALRKRFASGEIDEDEFTRGMKVLRETML